MHQLRQLDDFFSAITDDPRINTTHISIYVALLKLWSDCSFENPVRIFSSDVMSLCKISGLATYHKSIRELDEYGYIRYVPSFYRLTKSLVYLTKIEIKQKLAAERN